MKKKHKYLISLFLVVISLGSCFENREEKVILSINNTPVAILGETISDNLFHNHNVMSANTSKNSNNTFLLYPYDTSKYEYLSINTFDNKINAMQISYHESTQVEIAILFIIQNKEIKFKSPIKK